MIKDDLQTSTPCLTRSVYVLLMTSQLMTELITIATRAREKWYLTS